MSAATASSGPGPELAVHRPGARRMGFFTDTTVCIGCKACEVACKQWNDLPADGSTFQKGGSYDHTGALAASTWRHVRFVERIAPSPEDRADARARLAAGAGGRLPAIPASGGSGALAAEAPEGDRDRGGAGADQVGDLVDMAERGASLAPDGGRVAGPGDPGGAGAGRAARGPGAGAAGLGEAAAGGDGEGTIDVGRAVADMDRWLFMSDVCKHCTNAGCLDVCPTGAIIRTEFETVFIQPDVCNGCGYCVPACPFGVVDRDRIDGRAGKCTLCYDRLQDGLEPACAKACPTDSIQFGPYEELVERARGRVLELHERGLDRAYLYGAGDEPGEEIAGGLGAFFLLSEPPERFGLPAAAASPVQENLVPATASAVAAGVLAAAGVAASFLVSRRQTATGKMALARARRARRARPRKAWS